MATTRSGWLRQKSNRETDEQTNARNVLEVYTIVYQGWWALDNVHVPGSSNWENTHWPCHDLSVSILCYTQKTANLLYPATFLFPKKRFWVVWHETNSSHRKLHMSQPCKSNQPTYMGGECTQQTAHPDISTHLARGSWGGQAATSYCSSSWCYRSSALVLTIQGLGVTSWRGGLWSVPATGKGCGGVTGRGVEINLPKVQIVKHIQVDTTYFMRCSMISIHLDILFIHLCNWRPLGVSDEKCYLDRQRLYCSSVSTWLCVWYSITNSTETNSPAKTTHIRPSARICFHLHDQETFCLEGRFSGLMRWLLWIGGSLYMYWYLSIKATNWADSFIFLRHSDYTTADCWANLSLVRLMTSKVNETVTKK